MKLPSRMLDMSVPLDNETVLDPPFMRPKIDYSRQGERALLLASQLPGLQTKHLPEGEGLGVGAGPPLSPTTAPTWTRPIISSRRPSAASR